MSVYNGEAFLNEAIDSILAQTFGDFEFIIIDDGSTDVSPEILASYHDKRIKVYPQSNKGLIKSLNRAIGLARGEYLARMDADDVSEPSRLERQLAGFAGNSDLVVLGSHYHVVDEHGRLLDTIRTPIDGVYRLWLLQFQNTFAHGTVMMHRRRIVEAGAYSEQALHVEDYELWSRIANPVNTGILSEVLYRYRVLDSLSQVSRTNYAFQTLSAAAISNRNLQTCDASLTEPLCRDIRRLYWDRDQGRVTVDAVRAIPGLVKMFCIRYGIDASKQKRLEKRVRLDALRFAARTGAASAAYRAPLATAAWEGVPVISVFLIFGSGSQGCERVLERLNRQLLQSNRFEVLLIPVGSPGVSDHPKLDGRSFPARYIRYSSMPSSNLDQAVNLAWSESVGQYVVYLDDRDEPCAEWFSTALTIIETDLPPLVGGPHLPKGSSADSADSHWRPSPLQRSKFFMRRDLFGEEEDYPSLLEASGEDLLYGRDTPSVAAACRRVAIASVRFDRRLRVSFRGKASTMGLARVIRNHFSWGRAHHRSAKRVRQPVDERIGTIIRSTLVLLFRAVMDLAVGSVMRDCAHWSNPVDYLTHVMAIRSWKVGVLTERFRRHLISFRVILRRPSTRHGDQLSRHRSSRKL